MTITIVRIKEEVSEMIEGIRIASLKRVSLGESTGEMGVAEEDMEAKYEGEMPRD